LFVHHPCMKALPLVRKIVEGANRKIIRQTSSPSSTSPRAKQWQSITAKQPFTSHKNDHRSCGALRTQETAFHRYKNVASSTIFLPWRNQHTFFSTMAETKSNSPPSGDVVIIANELEKPLLDKRSYRMIRLSNQLEALLIHDPETDKGSAALDVNVGSFSDPRDMPGLAHAVEHMLFMGTEKVRSLRL
jgi:hypothetical protein